MDSTLGLSFLILIFSSIYVYTQETRVSMDLPTGGSTWSRAMSSNSCAIFSGDILKNISTARASVHATEVNKVGWVGAFSYFTDWISLTGCKLVKPSDIQAVSTSIHEGGQQNSVLFCERKCQNSTGSIRLFALSEFHCFCLSRSPVSSGSCIPTYCPGDLNDFCGSKGVNYASGVVSDFMVYIVDTSIPTNTSGAGDCLSVKYTNDVLLSSYNKVMRVFQNPDGVSCSTENGFICKQVGAVIAELSRKHYNRPRRTWNDAVRECYKQYGYQISSDADSAVQNNSVLVASEKAWIGSFRKHYEFTISKNSDLPSSQSNIHCVAARVDAVGQITLSNHNCNENLPVWCLDYTPPVTPDSNTVLTSNLSVITPTSVSANWTLISMSANWTINSTQIPTTSVADNIIVMATTNELDVNITISVLATLFVFGMFIIIAILLRRCYIKTLDRKRSESFRPISSISGSSEENRKIKRINIQSDFDQPDGIINTESVYSVIIENDAEAPRYSEVVYNDMWKNNEISIPNLYANAHNTTEAIQASPLKRRSGYIDMRPRRYIFMSPRRRHKRESQGYVVMSKGETSGDGQSNYVKMSIEDPPIRKSQGYIEASLEELSEKNELVCVEMTLEEFSKLSERKGQGYMVMSLGEMSKMGNLNEKSLDTFSKRENEGNLKVSEEEMPKRKSHDYVEITEMENPSSRESCGILEMSAIRLSKRESSDGVVDFGGQREST